ncbi:MAG: DRTGG domain-containing protein [Candidatus Eisenbacteria bacterium]|nr:DRTGG domain-containing protein [Candidatus Eisenbacteria bacterium]
MRLTEIVALLNADALVLDDGMDREIETVHASDLISEVLASCSRGALWLTGLLDLQIVNTAELFDLAAVVFVGNRRPSEGILALARDEGIPILATRLTMFETCGLLHARGLRPGTRGR